MPAVWAPDVTPSPAGGSLPPDLHAPEVNSGRPGNVALAGSEAELVAAMRAAAGPGQIASALRSGLATCTACSSTAVLSGSH